MNALGYTLTIWMKQIQSKWNTSLDDIYAIKATRVTQFMLMLTSFIKANDSSSLDILLNAYKTSLMDLTMA